MDLTDEEYNLAPRMVFTDTEIADSTYTATVILMDTERESDIGLGPDYPFDPLGAGECIVSDAYSENFGIGETITFVVHGDLYDLVQVQADFYNCCVDLPHRNVNLREFPTVVECTITDFIEDESYGKWPDSGADQVIIMEYNEFFPYVT